MLNKGIFKNIARNFFQYVSFVSHQQQPRSPDHPLRFFKICVTPHPPRSHVYQKQCNKE